MLASKLLPGRPERGRQYIIVGFDLVVPDGCSPDVIPDEYSLEDHGDEGRYVLCGNSKGFVAEGNEGDDVLVFDSQDKEVADDIAQHLHSWYVRRNGSASFFRTAEGCDLFGVIYQDVNLPQPPLIGVRVEELSPQEESCHTS